MASNRAPRLRVAPPRSSYSDEYAPPREHAAAVLAAAAVAAAARARTPASPAPGAGKAYLELTSRDFLPGYGGHESKYHYGLAGSVNSSAPTTESRSAAAAVAAHHASLGHRLTP